MNTATVASLLLLYLIKEPRYQVYIDFTEEVHVRSGTYHLIQFKAFGELYEIKVHNPDFIIIKRKNMPGRVCDSMHTAREEIDNILVHGILSYE